MNLLKSNQNKNTLSKTNRARSLLKEFLRAKEVDKEIENLEAKELDEVLCAFIVDVKKKGPRRIRANNIEVVHFKLRPLFTKRRAIPQRSKTDGSSEKPEKR